MAMLTLKAQYWKALSGENGYYYTQRLPKNTVFFILLTSMANPPQISLVEQWGGKYITASAKPECDLSIELVDTSMKSMLDQSLQEVLSKQRRKGMAWANEIH